jgi:hypothetical protein
MQHDDFGLSLSQKILSILLLFALSSLVMLIGPVQGTGATILFVLNALLVAVASFFISAAWVYKLVFQEKALLVRNNRGEITIPYEKIGLLVKSGTTLFPSLLLVLRNAEIGQPVPTTGIDPQALAQIEEYQKRNPGKKLTVVQIPGRYLRSITGFAAELAKRVPPVRIDSRLQPR